MSYRFILLLFFLFVSSVNADEQASEYSLIRRVYLDLLGRLPNVEEFTNAEKQLQNANGYNQLVDALLKNSEFKENLSWQIVRHYGPLLKQENAIGLERARIHIEEKYLKTNTDFRKLISNILTAKGIEAYNPLVRFYDLEETSVSLATRFTERVLGMPLACAQCHDHKFYPELRQKDFWGLTGFFQDTHIAYAKTKNELMQIKKDMAKVGRDVLDDKVYFNTWIYNEDKGISLFADRKKEYIGNLPYYDKEYMSEDSMMTEDESAVLKAPQMLIYEPKKTAGAIDVQYRVELEYFNVKAALPLDAKPDRSRKYPRDNAALWMTGSNSKYFDRSTVNWVVNWLLGEGIKMPVTDVYFTESDQKEKFEVYATQLRSLNYDLAAFVKSIVLSNHYKVRNRMFKEDAESLDLRSYRYLNGRHIANGFYKNRMDEVAKAAPGSPHFTARAKVEFMKFLFMEKNFQSALKPELYAPGNVSQAQLTATSEAWLKFVEDMADEGFNSKEPIETWLTKLFIITYTRYPTVEEVNYLLPLLKRRGTLESSGFYDVVWAIVNSPEMRIY